MEGVLNTRSMIFTIYGDYIRHYGGEIWIKSLIELLKVFGHNEQSVRAAISRMHKQGWVSSRKEGNKSYYYLTELGMERMEEAAHRIFKLKPSNWDGLWRMLIYSIPEERRNIRDELRKELVWSGFGQISNSVWLSPNDLKRQVSILIKKYEIESNVHFFETTYIGPGNQHSIVNACWNIDHINEKYEEFIRIYQERWLQTKERLKNGTMSDAECFAERTRLVHEYRKFLFIDPGLPEELLPVRWLGTAAAELFTAYYKDLAEPSSRFFETIFQKGNPLKRKNKNYDMYYHPLMADD